MKKHNTTFRVAVGALLLFLVFSLVSISVVWGESLTTQTNTSTMTTSGPRSATGSTEAKYPTATGTVPLNQDAPRFSSYPTAPPPEGNVTIQPIMPGTTVSGTGDAFTEPVKQPETITLPVYESAPATEVPRPSDTDTVSGGQIVTNNQTIIQTNPTDAQQVEYYAKPINTTNELYLGSGEKTTDGTWKLQMDSNSGLPNGDYSVTARITNPDGQYQSGQMPVRVDVPADVPNVDPAALATAFDSDKDGIPNQEEIRLGTDPLAADTDRDGHIDGDEVNNGFDPLKSSQTDKGDKIIFQSPKERGVVDAEYVVEKIESSRKESGKNVLALTGKALPNAFVTLYIYSENPIIVAVKTDAQGNWQYELDKELPDGDHEVYVAVTDNTGKITAKSEPLRFVKTAEAVTTVNAYDMRVEEKSPLRKSRNEMVVFALLSVLIFSSVALALIGIVTTYKHHKHE